MEYSPSIKIWQQGEVVLVADELKVELKNIILNIKGDSVHIENKNKIESLQEHGSVDQRQSQRT